MSDLYPDLCTELIRNYGITCYNNSPVSCITGLERYHADMSVCHLGNNCFVLSEECTGLSEMLNRSGAETFSECGITARNPLLNACILGDKIICCKKTTSRIIIDHSEKNNIKVIDVRQRYVRCSTAVIAVDAVVTSDSTIADVCTHNSIDCLSIPSGYITLKGYDYGFIGGCCGLVSNDMLVFTGRIQDHPSYRDIRSFCLDHGVHITSLGNTELLDIGGIIPIYY